MKESFEYYDEETGFFVFIPGDDFKKLWIELSTEVEEEEEEED